MCTLVLFSRLPTVFMSFMSYIMHEKAPFMLLRERRLCLFWWTDRSSNKPEAFSRSACPQAFRSPDHLQSGKLTACC